MIDIYIDTREKQALRFNKDYISNVYSSKLPFGDYGCKVEGQTIPIVFERKSLGDLFGTLGKGHDRFRRECNRATEAGFILAVIIEKPFKDVVVGYKRSKMEGISIVRTLFTLMIKHKIPFLCCNGRKEMADYISEFYYSYAKQLKKGE